MPGLSQRPFEATNFSIDAIYSYGREQPSNPVNLMDAELTLDGILDDKHSGETRELKRYESQELAGVTVANDRQISIVNADDMYEIAYGLELPIHEIQLAAKQPIDRFMAVQLGANLLLRTTSGQSLNEAAAPGRVFVFGELDTEDPASVRITEYNAPCGKPMGVLEETMGRLGIGLPHTGGELKRLFMDTARQRRGWVGSVYSTGQIAIGHLVSVQSPVGVPAGPIT